MGKLKRILAFVCMVGIVLTEMNISADTKAVNDLGWSDWSLTCPSLPAGYKMETRTVYRYRDKEFMSSTNSYMSGWELSSSTECWGEWSDWQDEEISESDDHEVATRDLYRYREKETTSSSSSVLYGWTQYDSVSSWGSWSDWQDSAVNGSSTRKVETRLVETQGAYTQYRYARWNNENNTYWHFCNVLAAAQRGGTWHVAYTPWMNSPISGENNHSRCSCPNNHYNMDVNSNQRKYRYNGSNWYWQETQTVPAQYKTQYRYADASTNYYYYKWSDWSDWDTVSYSESATREVETKQQYREREKDMMYDYYRWGVWSQYSVESPVQLENREVESAVQYRWINTVITPTATTSAPAYVIQSPATQNINNHTSKFTTAAATTAVTNTTKSSYNVKTINVKKKKKKVSEKIKSKKKKITLKKGDIISGKSGEYEVKKASEKEVEYNGNLPKKRSKLEVPDQIVYGGKTYKVTSIASGAFYKDSSLKEVTIGKNIKVIGDYAFQGCMNLETVFIGSDVTVIGNKAFYQCNALKKVTIISKKIKRVGKNAFIKTAKTTKRDKDKNSDFNIPIKKARKYQKLFRGKI